MQETAGQNGHRSERGSGGSVNELVVLDATSRDELRHRIDDLDASLSAHPDAQLADVAFSLVKPPGDSGGSRLAMVAGDTAELRTRLERAKERLADPSCRQIRDMVGIYYADEPLAAEGHVAYLFPGEGAQYLNMLADLHARFPDVREAIEAGDTLTLESQNGHGPLSRFNLFPSHASAEERAQAEADIRLLFNSILSVLVADWAIERVLSRLAVRPAMVAGHSAGELAALVAAGCVDRSGGSISAMSAALEDQTVAPGDESVLLAVGSSAEKLRKVLTENLPGVDPASWQVAMDNCPHQTVLVTSAVNAAEVEAALSEARVMYERLPFQRPYHTPRFEPYMGKLRDLFAAVDFRPPQLPLYSCTTGDLFPQQSDAIRELVLSHWVSPVEFTRMIRRMHADGARLFVEVGPRGNLSAFVQDILRGERFLALPADQPHRPGLTQLNHLVGQLYAHHVDVDLRYLFEERAVNRIESLFGGGSTGANRLETNHGDTLLPDTPAAPAPLVASEQRIAGDVSPGGGRQRDPRTSSVLNAHWQVMEQFLDDQQTIVRQYLDRHPRGGAPEGRVGRSAPVTNPVAPAPLAPPIGAGAGRTPDGGPLVDEIVRHEPGVEIVLRHRMDVAEDCFALDHTVGGRDISRVNPEQRGLPVMPMTFSLEFMAEAATLLVPGKVVTALEKVRVMRWLPYDDLDPTTIEIVAKVVPAEEGSADGAVRVTAEIRDLGSASSPPEAGRWPASTGTVVLEDAYRPAPVVGLEPLPNGREPTVDVPTLYRNLFHGPLLKGIVAIDEVNETTLDARMTILPREGVFQSKSDPRFHVDPVAVDVAMHPAAAWHLEQPDQSGRILLPIEIGRMDMYGPAQPEGTELKCRCSVLAGNARQFTHEGDVIDSRGRVWCSLRGIKCWRFYLPFGDVNFHGPKDTYFISQPFAAGRPERTLPPPDGGDATLERFGPGRTARAASVRLEPSTDLMQPAMLRSAACITLSEDEYEAIRAMKDASDEERGNWLYRRIAIKDACRILGEQTHGQKSFIADIEVSFGADGRPVASPRQAERPDDFPTVAIAQHESLICALATTTKHAGIALVPIGAEDDDGESLDAHHRGLVQEMPFDAAEAEARIHAAREAVARAVGCDVETGVTVEQAAGEVFAVSVSRSATAACPEFADRLIEVQTAVDGELAVASTLGEEHTG